MASPTEAWGHHVPSANALICVLRGQIDLMRRAVLRHVRDDRSITLTGGKFALDKVAQLGARIVAIQQVDSYVTHAPARYRGDPRGLCGRGHMPLRVRAFIDFLVERVRIP